MASSKKPYSFTMPEWLRKNWIFNSRINCYNSLDSRSFYFYIAFRAIMNPVALSRTRYTFPYLPLPMGLITSSQSPFSLLSGRNRGLDAYLGLREGTYDVFCRLGSMFSISFMVLEV